RLQELEAERPTAPGIGPTLDRLLAQPLDLLQPRLRLAGLRGLVAEARHEPLQPLELLGLPLRRLREVLLARSLLPPPHMPLAGEERRAAAIELEHRRRHSLEEPAVVGDEDDAGV